uniref:Uncharacterized protein n=1 Tax=Manihot esculenta TaxID=3983 RepID=A0A2C9VG75_MANES
MYFKTHPYDNLSNLLSNLNPEVRFKTAKGAQICTYICST